MNTYKRYFILQKLMGVALLAVTILSIIVLKDATVALFTVPGGLMFVFSKKLIFKEFYLDKMYEEEESH